MTNQSRALLTESAPNNAVEPTAPMATCTISTSLMARRLTAGVRRTAEWIELLMTPRTDKTCGLTISPSFVRADEVIE